MADRATARLAEAVEIVRATEFRNRPGEPSPASYYRDLLAGSDAVRREAARRQTAYLRDVFGFAGCDAAGSKVLEVGSGFGLGLLALACLDAGSVLGVEIVPWQVEWARAWIERLPDELASRLETRAGTATALPLPDGDVDVVLSLEAISHYLDYRSFLAESWRVLRPGGVLIISDGNNALNPLLRRQRKALWAEHEAPPGRARARGDDYPFHFVDKRRDLILEAYPQLDVDTALRLALLTSGMVGAEVKESAQRFFDSGQLPSSPYRPGDVTVHPDHEMVMERLFNPLELAKELRSHGFETRLRGHWAGATTRRSLLVADRVLSALGPASLPTARVFRLAAYKSTSAEGGPSSDRDDQWADRGLERETASRDVRGIARR
jgi:SAM-dependent methyltransferase